MEIDTRYQTPKEVCIYMASLVEKGKFVLEPTPGIGNLVRALKNKGFNVQAPKDYFIDRDVILKTKYDAVVMNPPFSEQSCDLTNAPDEWKNMKGLKIGYNILNDCMQISNTIIALMPLHIITDSDVRLRAFKRWGFKTIIFLPRKTFDYLRIPVAIFHFEKNFSGETIFKVYDTLNDNKTIKLEL